MSTRTGGTPICIEVPILGEVRLRPASEGSAEFTERPVYRRRIARVGADPDVKVLGIARFGMLDHRIPIDDEVPNLSVAEELQ
jgi:hypothetical protein